MIKDQVVSELVKSANENGFITTLYGMFGKCIKVSISFTKHACETSIDDLDFSVRANNAMKRAGVFTVGEVVDMISGDNLSNIRNLGKKTANEIKTRVLACGYECLTEREKILFFYDVVGKNVMRNQNAF